MALERKHATHGDNEAYSDWHRPNSINRFVKNRDLSNSMSMIDIDACMYMWDDESTHMPLALVEAAVIPYGGHNPHFKPVTANRNLAKMTKLIPCVVVQIELSENLNPHSIRGTHDISMFHVRCEWPRRWPEDSREYIRKTPEEYVQWELEIRRKSMMRVFSRKIDVEWLTNVGWSADGPELQAYYNAITTIAYERGFIKNKILYMNDWNRSSSDTG